MSRTRTPHRLFRTMLVSLVLGSLLVAWSAHGTQLPDGPKPNPALPTPALASAVPGAAPAENAKHAAPEATVVAPGSAQPAPAAGAKSRPTGASSGEFGAASTFRMLTCAAVLDGGFTTTSSTAVVVRLCTLDVPESGFVYITVTSSVGLGAGGPSELRASLNIDSPTGNPATDRWVNVYSDAGDGTDKSIAASMLQTISAGSHTFYFLVSRYTGSGAVQLYDASLSVLFVPTSATDVQGCGVVGNTVWNTSETSFQPVRSCTLNVPASGFVFISANASAGLASGGAPYEGRFRVGVDNVSGTASSDRWVNLAADTGDGTDETVATSLLTSVAPGAHTFYFSGSRYAGTGPVQLYDPTLSVLYFQAPNTTAKVCGASGSDSWTNATTTYATLRSCSLSVPESTTVFIDATGSAGLNDTGAGNQWEGQFRLGIDNDTGTSLSDRWVNIEVDGGDGTDKSVAESMMANVGPGVHTFYFVGRRYSGSGTLRVYSPSLTVIVPLAQPEPTPTPTPTPTTQPTPTMTPVPTPAPPKIMVPFVQR